MPRTMKVSQAPKTDALGQLKKADELVCGCTEKQIEKACIISITAARRKDCRRITGCSWMAKAEQPDKNPVSSAQHYRQSLAEYRGVCFKRCHALKVLMNTEERDAPQYITMYYNKINNNDI